MSEWLSFRFPDDFVDQYKDKEVKWGFPVGAGNTLGEIVFYNNYSRIQEDGSKERWHETCRRVIEGTYSILKDHCAYHRTHWNELKAQASAREAFDRMFDFKWTPPGRGLWAMGTPMVNGEWNSAPLYNCSMISTKNISNRSVYEATFPFSQMCVESMSGIGVGYDTRGAGRLTLHQPDENKTETFVVPDSREGWAQSLAVLLESFFFERSTVAFDYTQLRPAGAPLKRFGGTASGFKPLLKAHTKITELLSGRAGEKITSRDINDIMCLIGKAVVAGGSRRSATLCLGEFDDKEFVNLKNFQMFPERNGPDGWAYMSNNSVVVDVGQDYDQLVDQIADNGEPGLQYLELAKKFGRLGEPNDQDVNIVGTNPCGEVFLEHCEKCNLSEIYPTNHESMEDFLRTIKFAFIYNKAVTLVPTQWPEVNEVINRNRRIGLSVSGSALFADRHGWSEYRQWLDDAYGEVCRWDEIYSKWLGVRESIRKTTSKPSGSVSLLANVTPGVHWPTHSTYIRRIRLRKDSSMVDVFTAAGYVVELDIMDPDNTAIVELPTRGPEVRTESEVSVWEKVALAALVQKHFADNAVSLTATFLPEEREQISSVLRAFEGQLKVISFLPITEGGSYAQMPYEAISEDVYRQRTENLKELDWKTLYEGDSLQEASGEKFCGNDHCEV